MLSRISRKDLQLCAQVRDALYWVLGAAVGDERLADLQVIGVEPLPNASRLLITVTASDQQDFGEMEFRLEAAIKTIRYEVARTINRRKTPELVFRVLR